MLRQYLLFSFLVAMAATAKGKIPKEHVETLEKLFDCSEDQKKFGLKMFNVFLSPHLPGGTQSRPRQVYQCKIQLQLPYRRRYHLVLDFAGKYCYFNLPTVLNENRPGFALMNLDTQRRQNKEKSLHAHITEQISKCNLPPYSKSIQHPGIKKESAVACKEEDKAMHLRTFINWLDAPGVTEQSFDVQSCVIQDKNRAITLGLADTRGNKVTVSLYIDLTSGELNVASDPQDYIDALLYRKANPRHPGAVDAPKQTCGGAEVGEFIKMFTDYVDNEKISSEHFDIQSCTVQHKDGRIVNMDLKYNKEKISQQTGFVSMYIASPNADPAVITDTQAFLEALGKAVGDVKVETYNHYFEDISYESFFEEHNKEKPTLVGGWTNQSNCKWIKDFATFIGLSEDAFNGATVTGCQTQVVNGLNVRFNLAQKGEADPLKLWGDHKSVQVTGYIPTYAGGASSFSTVPEDYVKLVQHANNILVDCADHEKRNFAKLYFTLAKTVGLRFPVVFSENVKTCKTSGEKFDVELSLNRHVCRLVAAVKNNALALEYTDCEMKSANL